MSNNHEIPRVFIDNPARQNIKNLYNEKTLEFLRSVEVSLPYPYPYGFFLNTTSGDGDNLDCFVITKEPLKQADLVEVTPIGMMEVIEDGDTDHKILACLKSENVEIDGSIKEELVTFIEGVFSHLPNKHMEIGRFLGPEAARELIAKSVDK